jgi:hypothetical protein
MRILLDQGTPAPLRRYLPTHEVKTVGELGWAELVNGELLIKASGQFDLLITTDQNLRYQQNAPEQLISILVLSTTAWPRIERGVSLRRGG